MITHPECMFCGEPETLDLFEIWREDRAFMIETCCEDLQNLIHDDLSQVPTAVWRALFAEYGIAIRRVLAGVDGMFCYTTGAPIDFGLELVGSKRKDEPGNGVTRDEARAFVKNVHRHRGPEQTEHTPPVSWRFGFGVRNGGELIGVAMVGRPVARMLDKDTIVEVNRVAVVDNKLGEHACSMLYAAAAREAKRRGFHKIITYTLESESGASLRAAGWTPEATTTGGSWNRKSRQREDVGPTCRKVRWSRQLRRNAA